MYLYMYMYIHIYMYVSIDLYVYMYSLCGRVASARDRADLQAAGYHARALGPRQSPRTGPAKSQLPLRSLGC